MAILVTKWWGTALVENGAAVRTQPFPADVHAIADRLLRMRRGEVLEEEQALAGPGVSVTEERQRALGPLVALRPLPDTRAQAPAAPLLREAVMLVARDESRQASAERDRFLVQAVRAMDELTRTANTLMERLRDWYALHFPEALGRFSDPAKLAQALAEAPDRAEVARRVGFASPEDSIGTGFTPEELAAVQGLARAIGSLFAERSRQETLIEKEARVVAPTLSGVVGPVLAARLLSLANGLGRLAAVPASTVQTLGAENALFLHLKEGKRPPKHGVLFQHPLVNTAPRWQRGRIARLLAGHASRAARLDAFSQEPQDRSADLTTHLKAQLERLRQRAAQPRARDATPSRKPMMRPRPAPAAKRGGR